MNNHARHIKLEKWIFLKKTSSQKGPSCINNYGFQYKWPRSWPYRWKIYNSMPTFGKYVHIGMSNNSSNVVSTFYCKHKIISLLLGVFFQILVSTFSNCQNWGFFVWNKYNMVKISTTKIFTQITMCCSKWRGANVGVFSRGADLPYRVATGTRKIIPSTGIGTPIRWVSSRGTCAVYIYAAARPLHGRKVP
jgi:hypothetical protein